MKTGIAVLLLLGMTVLGGCQGVEPENRIYPMAMAAEATDEGYQVILGMPDMQSATGQEKQGEGESRTVLCLEGKILQKSGISITVPRRNIWIWAI